MSNSDSDTGDADVLRQVLDSLMATIPETSECAPMEPHIKGGFSIFLEYRDDDAQAIIEFLTKNGWMPCF